MKNSPQPIPAEARKERVTGLLNDGARALEDLEDLLMRVRVDLVELKRTGTRDGVSELVADTKKLTREIERLAEPL